MDADRATLLAREAERRAQGIYDLAALAFRNPRFVRTEFVSETQPLLSVGGQVPYSSGSATSSKSTNIEERQE